MRSVFGRLVFLSDINAHIRCSINNLLFYIGANLTEWLDYSWLGIAVTTAYKFLTNKSFGNRNNQRYSKALN